MTAIAISSGDAHSCAVTSAGTASCWGENGYGELGDGTTTERHAPVNVLGLDSPVQSIAAGWAHTCALTVEGGVKCWGFNRYGELGDGTNTDSLSPVDVVGLTSGVVAISAGFAQTCAVTDTGALKCWGDNEFGQLGDGTTNGRRTPVDVLGLSSGVASVSTGRFHTCAVTTSGRAKCWGLNGDGQLGDGTQVERLAPVDVVGLTSGVAAIAAGGAHTCAVTTEGAAKCWGENVYGQIGDGTETRRLVPTPVVGLDSGVQAIDGGDAETCAALGEGGARCWGLNLDGSLGDGGYETQALTPSRVIGLRGGASAVSRGFYYGCGLTTLGGAVCWGMNDYGQIGNGDGGGGHYTDSATEVVGFEGPKYVGVKRRGRGTVTSDPAAIDCGSACAHLFTNGTQVTLSATPDPGSVFLGWSGACSGTGTCSVVLDGDRVAVASFAGVSTSGSPNLTAPQRRLRLPFPGLVRSPPRCYCPARGG